MLCKESDFYNITAIHSDVCVQTPSCPLLERASRAVADRLSRDIGLDGVTSDPACCAICPMRSVTRWGEIAERQGINHPRSPN